MDAWHDYSYYNTPATLGIQSFTHNSLLCSRPFNIKVVNQWWKGHIKVAADDLAWLGGSNCRGSTHSGRSSWYTPNTRYTTNSTLRLQNVTEAIKCCHQLIGLEKQTWTQFFITYPIHTDFTVILLCVNAMNKGSCYKLINCLSTLCYVELISYTLCLYLEENCHLLYRENVMQLHIIYTVR